MAAAAAMLALLLLDLARRIVRSVGASALIAIAASLSALFLGYYLWGGVKELVTAALLPLGPLLAGQAAREDWPRRAWATLSLTVAAIIVVLGPGGGLWAIPILIPALALAWRRYGSRGALRLAIPVAVLAVILVLPVIFTPTGPFDPLNSGITGEAEIGNLYRPLSVLQAAEIWPSLDFRVDPHLNTLVRIISALCIALAAAAIGMALRWKRGDGIPLAGYVGGGAVGAAAIIADASTWVDAKVLATLSPGILFAALLALVIVSERTDFRLEARTALVVLLGFVVWGAFLAYQGTWLAPRAHYTELEKIGEDFDGEGPALVTEVSGYGPRHFLADLDPEGASDRRRRAVLLRNGEPTPDAVPVDLDEIRPDQLDPYNLLILRRGPATSRPPSEFRLAYSSDHYEVWRRTEQPGTLVKSLPREQSSTPDRSRAALGSPPWRARPEPTGASSPPGSAPRSRSSSTPRNFLRDGRRRASTPSRPAVAAPRRWKSRCPVANTKCGSAAKSSARSTSRSTGRRSPRSGESSTTTAASSSSRRCRFRPATTNSRSNIRGRAFIPAARSTPTGSARSS